LFSQNIPSYVPKDDLVGWWPFNGNANDESGNGYHGIVYGATLTADRNGNPNSAYSFNGSSDSILISNSDKFDLGGGLFSISVWLKNRITNPNVEIILSKGQNFLFLNNGGGYGFENYGKGLGAYNGIFNSDQWVHLVCVKTNLGYSYFVNGKKYDLIYNQFNQSLSDLRFQLILGQSTNRNKFAHSKWNGLIDNLLVYNRSLTDQEVEQLYTERPSCSNITPVISLIGKNTFCEGDTTILRTNTFKNAKYQWYKDGIKIPNENDSIYVSKQSGNYAVGVSNDSVCESRSSATNVKIYPKPISAKINENDTTLCEGETVVLTTENKEGYRFQWKKYGNYIPGATNGTLTVNSPGVYSVVTYSYCNDSIVSRTMVVHYKSIPSSNLIVEGKTTFCYGDSVKLKLDKKYGNSLQWFNGSSVISGETDSIYYAKTSGNYSLRLLDGRCFKNSTKDSITVELQQPKLHFFRTLICEGDTTNAYVGENDWSWGYKGVNTYTWLLNDQEVAVSSTSNPYLTINKAGIYKVRLSSATCNVFTNEVEIKNLSKIDVQYTTTSGTLIEKSPFSVTFSTISTASNLNWDFGDGSTSISKNPFHIFQTNAQRSDTSSYNVRLTSSNNECGLLKVKVLKVKSSENKLLSFEINQSKSILKFSGKDSNYLTLTMSSSTNLSNLVANFTSSPYSTVKLNGIVQQSGITVNNFTDTLKYVVIAEDGITRIYFVKVELKSSECDITSFFIPSPFASGVITKQIIPNTTITYNYVNLRVPSGTDLSKIVVAFTSSSFSVVSIGGKQQISGFTVNDFTQPLSYLVTAEDGITSQIYTIVINFSKGFEIEVPASINGFYNIGIGDSLSARGTWGNGDILKKSVRGELKLATSADSLGLNALTDDYVSKIILLYRGGGRLDQKVLNAQNAGAIAVVILNHGLQPDGSIKPDDVFDFYGGNIGDTNSLGLKVKIPAIMVSRNDRDKIVTAIKSGEKLIGNIGKILVPKSSACIISDFKLISPNIVGVISDSIITLNVPAETKLTSLLAQFTVSDYATVKVDSIIQVSGQTSNDFTKTVKYEVTAEEGTIKNYYVTVRGQICSGFFANLIVENDKSNDLKCTGKLTSNVGGGIQPYSYAWSTGATTVNLTDLCAQTYTLEVTDKNNCKLTVSKAVGMDSVINPCANFKAFISSVEPTGINATICNGSVVVKAEGGQAPYSYVWNNGVKTAAITEVCQGEYQVTVRDKNNCSISLNAKVAIDSTKNACNGFYAKVLSVKDDNGSCTGEIQTQTFGGKLPYSYKWNTSSTDSTLTKICKGVYTLEVMDANKCSFTIEKVVKSTAVIDSCKDFYAVVTELKDDVSEVSCNGKIVVQAKGGKIPYAYAWESGDTTSILENKCAGSYSATITDANNCKVFVSTSISKIQPQGVKLEAVITTKDASSAQTCDGSMFIQVTSGTAPYTYSHSNGDTGNQRTSLCSGVYTVTIKDAKGNEQTLNYVISNPVNTIQTIVNTLKDSVSIDTLKTKLQNECSIAYDAIDSVKIKEIVILSKDSVLVTWTVYAKDKQTFVSKKYVVNKGEGVYTLALSMYCKELKGIGSYFTASQKAYLKLGGNTTTIGITSIESPTMIRVYPNPFTDKVEVSMTEVLDYQIELMDVTGKRVYRQEFKQTKHMAIDFGQLSLGEYLLKVTNKDNVQIRKISRLY
jgi:hypothetical protein